MRGKKEKKPALEVNLNIIPLLESLGLDETLERITGSVQKGKTEVLDKLVAKAQQGKVEMTLSVGNKKKKVPISFVIKLKKD